MKNTALTLVFLIGSASGFACIPSREASSSRCSALNLLPGQGNELVAAYNAATCKEDDEEEYQAKPVALEIDDPEDNQTSAAARSFASLLFSLPSTLRKRSQNYDVVLYPMVGFKFVHHEDKFVALPTMSHMSCRLPSARNNEEVYGFFSPATSLDFHATDISEDPKTN
jgi:hypothetical protein